MAKFRNKTTGQIIEMPTQEIGSTTSPNMAAQALRKMLGQTPEEEFQQFAKKELFKKTLSTKQEKELQTIKPKPAETAGKVGGAKFALTQLGELEKLIFPKEGEVNKDFVTKLWAKMPTDERTIGHTTLYNAIDSIVRFKTGATATQDEMNNAMGAYFPRPWDSPKAAKFKMGSLKGLLKEILSEAEGKGGGITPKSDPLGVF